MCGAGHAIVDVVHQRNGRETGQPRSRMTEISPVQVYDSRPRAFLATRNGECLQLDFNRLHRYSFVARRWRLAAPSTSRCRINLL